ncbi:MAG TPA: zf-HC2 domain-containing protein [Candidatus Eisenbacteria bacterium]|nr:zf-HC2 domain-containing protein [Candidatus Eisenbacteria bacterium]
MNCHDAHRLFGGCWDDELTQAERDWLERHLAACARCRVEYDELARTLELAGSLPRIEPDAELVERVLARTRRATVAPDRVTLARPMGAWLATAAAGLAITGLLLAPWRPWLQAPHALPHAAAVMAQLTPVRQPELRHPVMAARSGAGHERVAAADTLFDHSEDVEMVLDPVVLRMHNGRASVVRSTTPAVHGEQAVISF